MVDDSGHHQEYLIKHITFQIQNCIQLKTRFSNFRIFRNSKMKDWFSTSMQFAIFWDLILSLKSSSEKPFSTKRKSLKAKSKKVLASFDTFKLRFFQTLSKTFIIYKFIRSDNIWNFWIMNFENFKSSSVYDNALCVCITHKIRKVLLHCIQKTVSVTRYDSPWSLNSDNWCERPWFKTKKVKCGEWVFLFSQSLLALLLSGPLEKSYGEILSLGGYRNDHRVMRQSQRILKCKIGFVGDKMCFPVTFILQRLLWAMISIKSTIWRFCYQFIWWLRAVALL